MLGKENQELQACSVRRRTLRRAIRQGVILPLDCLAGLFITIAAQNQNIRWICFIQDASLKPVTSIGFRYFNLNITSAIAAIVSVTAMDCVIILVKHSINRFNCYKHEASILICSYFVMNVNIIIDINYEN